MSRPPGAPLDPTLDAVHAARSAIRLERHFDVSELPRLRDATLPDGGEAAAALDAVFAFSLLEGHPAIDGEMSGTVYLRCQRCLQPVAVSLAEDFQLVLVADDEVRPEEFGAYEPVVVDASRVDLQWLAEEQALLALPLVPLHEPGECDEAEDIPVAPAVEVEKQRPFGNLRELLQKR